MKKILLLTAPCPDPDKTSLHLGDNRPPMGLGYLAASLKKNGHAVKIIDLYQFDRTTHIKNIAVAQEDAAQHLNIDLDYEVRLFKPDFIGMYIHTISYYEACKLARRLKLEYPYIKLMCGGPHPSVLPETIPDDFDHVVIGEGECASLDIVEGRQKNRIINGVRVKDLDTLPWPDYDWFFDKPYNWGLEVFGNNSLTIMPLNTSRGCPFPCKFCGVKYVSGSGYRFMSATKIFNRVIELKSKYSVDGFYFREDCFTANHKRLEEFCDLLIKNKINVKWASESRVRELTEPMIKKMAESGCIGLYIGVESGSPRMLRHMRKHEEVADFLEKFPILDKYGIKSYTTWIIGLPTETQDDRRFSNDLMKNITPSSFDKFVYIGIPKSDFYMQMDGDRSYEFKEGNGFIYPRGYLSLARQLYGVNDPRCRYVEDLYSKNNVKCYEETI